MNVLVTIPVGKIVTAVDGRSGSVHHSIGIERVDLEIPHHPTQLGGRYRRNRVQVSEIQPGCRGDVLCVAQYSIRVASPIPYPCPRCPRVSTSKDDSVWPPRV